MPDTATIPENSPGPAEGLTKKRGGGNNWADLSDLEKEERKLKIRAGQQKAREAKEGKAGGDKAPNLKAKKSGNRGPASAAASEQAEIDQIRAWLGMLLSAPAAAGAGMHDPWMVDHFVSRGPKLADELVKEAERNPKLRAWLIGIATVAGPAALVIELALYVGLPLIHFGIVPGAEAIAPLVGVPLVRPPAGVSGGGPRPGRDPQFVAPARGPAEDLRGEAPGGMFAEMEAEREAWEAEQPEQADELAAELADDPPTFAPPMPIEPV